MSEPLEGYAKFYLEVIDAVVETLETLKPEFLSARAKGPKGIDVAKRG